MSFYEYWIGRDANLDAIWRDYEQGAGYEQKFRQTTCHLLEIEFEIPPASDPLFASKPFSRQRSAIFMT
jgi:hypothetical protein